MKKLLLPLLLITTLALLVALPQIVVASEHAQSSHHDTDHETNQTHETDHEANETEHEGIQVRFDIRLTGVQQVPAVDTDAFGFAEVSLSADNSTLSFEVVVCNIANVTASHIHVGAAGTNGPIVLPFFASPPLFNSTDGCHTLAKGTRTSADLKLAPDNGTHTWTDFINELIAGNTYVNVHTTAHTLGEIRGQLIAHHENEEEHDDSESDD